MSPGIRFPVARNRVIPVELDILEQLLWNLHPASSWSDERTWRELCANARMQNHASHVVHDRIRYALGGDRPHDEDEDDDEEEDEEETLAARVSAESDDPRLEIILELLHDAEFRLLTNEEWKAGASHSFTFDFPVLQHAAAAACRANVAKIRKRAEDKWWQQRSNSESEPSLSSSAEGEWGAPQMLVFYRSISETTMTSRFMDPKLGVLIRRIVRTIGRIACCAPSLLLQPAGCCRERFAALDAALSAPMPSKPIALHNGARAAPGGDHPRRFGLEEQLGRGICSALCALPRKLTLHEPLLVDVVTVAHEHNAFALRSYDQIPLADIDVLSDVELQLRLVDKCRILLVCTLACYSIFKKTTRLFQQRADFAHVDTDGDGIEWEEIWTWLKLVFSHIAVLALLVIVPRKVISSFKNPKRNAQAAMLKSLYDCARNRDEGVLLRVSSLGHAQECKEELVGFAALSTFLPHGATVAELKQRAEELFATQLEGQLEDAIYIDFDAVGAVRKLLKHRRVTVKGRREDEMLRELASGSDASSLDSFVLTARALTSRCAQPRTTR